MMKVWNSPGVDLAITAAACSSVSAAVFSIAFACRPGFRCLRIPATCCGHDADNSYGWSAIGSTARDGTAYTDFLAKLNNGASTDGGAMTAITGCFAGHCDWRLPTIVELQTIFDATQGSCNDGSGACIDPAFGPTPAGYYWSATSSAGFPTEAWYLWVGGVDFTYKPSGLYVRAVRGGL
jgi:hypothetical protein